LQSICLPTFSALTDDALEFLEQVLIIIRWAQSFFWVWFFWESLVRSNGERRWVAFLFGNPM